MSQLLPCDYSDGRMRYAARKAEKTTRRWWSILAMGAQSAAIDCILGRDPQVWVPHQPPPLASVLAEADIAPEPSRLG